MWNLIGEITCLYAIGLAAWIGVICYASPSFRSWVAVNLRLSLQKALGSRTTRTIKRITATFFGLALILCLTILPSCQASPSSRVAPLATPPATAPSSTPDAKAAQDTARAIDAPLADAQAVAQSLPPTLPQRGALLADLDAIRGLFGKLSDQLATVLARSQAKDSADAAEMAWRGQVTKQYETVQAQLATSEADRAKEKAQYESRYQNFLFWAEVLATGFGVAIGAALLVYWHNLPGGLTTLAVTGAVVVALRVLGVIDLYKWQILGTVAALCLGYELAWLAWFRFGKKMPWPAALAATVKTWRVA